MKKHIIWAIVLLFMAALGLSLLCYPTASDYVKSTKYQRAIAEYERAVQKLEDGVCKSILTDAEKYNELVLDRDPLTLSIDETDLAAYRQNLNIPGTDVIGFVEIPSVDISLPIYHGADEAVMEKGVGHIEGSSLPVGGENTHSILIAHRGLAGDKLFTDVGKLTEGDTFTVYVLNETLTYEVDRIQTVEPYIPDELEIEDGMDLCTLVTCTPYGVNTHRLMVRAHRIETPNDYPRVNTFHFGLISLLLMVVIISAVTVTIVIIGLRHFTTVRTSREKREKRE